jgi:CrcB protein
MLPGSCGGRFDGIVMTFVLQLLVVAVGGAIGGGARFWISGMVARRVGETFPWGTLVVNVSGATVIGILAALLLAPGNHAVNHVHAWAGLVTGILGSYTTVSSFSLQTLALLRAGETSRALGNIAASLSLCLLAASLGYLATSRLWGP